MAKKPVIELKNIEVLESLSEETHCYSATLYVDGVKWGTVSNHGHGGSDDFHGIDGRNYGTIHDLDLLIAQTWGNTEEYPDLPYSLEIICGDLINEHLVRKDFKSAMRRKLLFVDPARPNDVLFFTLRKGEKVADMLPAARAKFTTYSFLADMPEADAFAAFRKGTGA